MINAYRFRRSSRTRICLCTATVCAVVGWTAFQGGQQRGQHVDAALNVGTVLSEQRLTVTWQPIVPGNVEVAQYLGASGNVAERPIELVLQWWSAPLRPLCFDALAVRTNPTVRPAVFRVASGGRESPTTVNTRFAMRHRCYPLQVVVRRYGLGVVGVAPWSHAMNLSTHWPRVARLVCARSRPIVVISRQLSALASFPWSR